MTRKSKELVHEGKYVAEVSVELIEDDTAWSPYLSPDDALKLDTVRLALRRGDIAEAARHGDVVRTVASGDESISGGQGGPAARVQASSEITMSVNPIENWDLFISHASEDKEAFVRPLALALERFGVRVWYDEYALNLGDSLSRSIDKGLANSDYGLVVLSPAFVAKRWPEYELRGLTAREMSGSKIIVPIWHNITQEEILRFSPPLADKLAVRSDQSTPLQIAVKIIKAVRPDLFTRILRRVAHYKFLDNAQVQQIPPAEIKPGPIQHPILPPEVISRIRLVRASLLEIDPHSMAYWIDGFKRDSHPSSEVAHWEHVAAVYLEYSRMVSPMSHEQKQKIYNFVSSLWLNTTDVQLLERAKDLPEDALEIILNLYSQPEPPYDLEEESAFLDIESTTENRDERSTQYDMEHFPTDLPEDLIRELIKAQETKAD